MLVEPLTEAFDAEAADEQAFLGVAEKIGTPGGESAVAEVEVVSGGSGGADLEAGAAVVAAAVHAVVVEGERSVRMCRREPVQDAFAQGPAMF
jgi:hypothetical protein